MEDLLTLVKRFNAAQGKLQHNPRRDYALAVDSFVEQIQAQGQDLSQWSEDQWREALEKLGVPADDVASMLESVASWGVVDNTTWR